jgi:hypothetical protein
MANASESKDPYSCGSRAVNYPLSTMHCFTGAKDDSPPFQRWVGVKKDN